MIEFARGDYALPALESIRKSQGIPWRERKVLGTVSKPFYTSKPPKGPGSWLWQAVRNSAAMDIRKAKQLNARLTDLIQFAIDVNPENLTKIVNPENLAKSLVPSPAAPAAPLANKVAGATTAISGAPPDATSQAASKMATLKKYAITGTLGAAGGLGIDALSNKNQNYSSKSNRIIRFAGGYVNTDEGIKKESGVGAHFDRAAGRYIGGVLFPPIGIAPGYLIDRARRHHNIIKTKQEPEAPWLSKGEALCAKLDDLIEFARGDRALRAGLGEIGTVFPRYGAHQSGLAKRLGQIRQRQPFPSILKSAEDERRQALNKTKLLSGKLVDLIEFATDPRPRNRLGEFSGNQEGAPDPNAMVRTYHMMPPQQQASPGLGNVAVTSAIAGAAGTGTTLGIKALVEQLKGIKKPKKV